MYQCEKLSTCQEQGVKEDLKLNTSVLGVNSFRMLSVKEAKILN